MTAAIDWTPELVGRLCEEIAGGRGIAEISKEEWCPSEPSVYRRMAANEEFAEQIAKARAAQQDREVDECVRMADEASEDDWQVVKLRIWARQWRASKLAPRKYGERLQIDSKTTQVPATAEDLVREAAAMGLTPEQLFGRRPAE